MPGRTLGRIGGLYLIALARETPQMNPCATFEVPRSLEGC
jgi:hypothetical protein